MTVKDKGGMSRDLTTGLVAQLITRLTTKFITRLITQLITRLIPGRSTRPMQWDRVGIVEGETSLEWPTTEVDEP